MRTSDPQKVPASLAEAHDPSEGGGTSLAAARKSRPVRSRPVRLVIEKAANGQLNASPPYGEEYGWTARLTETFGSNSSEFALEQLTLLINTTKTDLSPEDRTRAVNAMLASVVGLQPQNEVEGSLAVQMAATHQLAMTFLDRAKQAQHASVVETSGNMAVKLLRAYTGQVEALAKLRRGGNQTMRVEHVHVHSGGQAIVGNVTRDRGGGE